MVFAADGRPWLGPVIVAALAIGQLLVLRRWATDLLLLMGAGAFGYLADSVLVQAGVFEFPAPAQLGGPSTVWMAALWVNFAMTIPLALSWLRGKPALAAALGAIGGPLAYWGGIGLGAIETTAGTTSFLVAVGVEWALASPALVALAEACGSFSESTADSVVPAEAA